MLINDTLRQKMRYDGVVITDDLSMGAIQRDRGEATVGALGAGCDAVIVFGTVSQVRATADAVAKAAAAGRLSPEDLEASARRLDGWQARIREGGSAP